MPLEPYRKKKGDTDPPFRCQLVDADGLAQPIQTGDTVEFHMAPQIKGMWQTLVADAEIDPDAAATLEEAGLAGHVRYLWQPTDTPKVGLFNVEIQLNLAGGGKKTFPNDGYFVVEVVDELA